MGHVHPVVFQPILPTRIWGVRLACNPSSRQAGSPGGPIGESWESWMENVSPRLPPVPILGELAFTGDGLWGAICSAACDRSMAGPLLIKFLDAAEPLSVQVHPNPGRRPAARRRGARQARGLVRDRRPTLRPFSFTG